MVFLAMEVGILAPAVCPALSHDLSDREHLTGIHIKYILFLTIEDLIYRNFFIVSSNATALFVILNKQ